MRRKASPAVVVLLSLTLAGAPRAGAQQQMQTPSTPAKPAPVASPQASPTPQREGGSTPYEDEVVRITSNLVQFDAVVTDKQGKPVTDLKAEDFEVLVDGTRQPLTNFSYISIEPSATVPQAPRAEAQKSSANASSRDVPPPPPASARLRPEQVQRTIALVIDDLGLSFESIARARGSLKRFVNEQMQPGDMVAVIRTSAGIGALQQFTSDKQLLLAAIDRVQWYPAGRGGVSAFAAIERDPISDANTSANIIRAFSAIAAAPTGGGPSESQRPINPASSLNLPDQTTSITDIRDTLDLTDRYREELFAAGTLGALNFVVRGLKELPGRKSVVLFSDGMAVFRKDGKSERVLETLRRLTDLANRASVVIYSMDARGLSTLGFTGEDNTASLHRGQAFRRALDNRSSSYHESQNGLNYLAEQTGGLFLHNSNDLGDAIRTVLQDQTGFYLIGYRPDESVFKTTVEGLRFHELTVRVRRDGYKVRTRNGFYGITEESARPSRATRAEQLYGALSSPFAAGDLHVRLTSLFGNDAATGSFMRSLLHIDADRLTFTKEADGSYKSDIDVLALTFGERGEVVNSINRTDTVRVEAARYEDVQRYGLDYIVNVPVQRAGAYQLRVALRDVASERTGAASQFIEVPDLKDDRLTLSGIVLSGNDLPTSAATRTDEAAAGAALNYHPHASPSVRRIVRGTELFYNFMIYNARAASAGAPPVLLTQVRLFRDGRQLFAGKQLPVDATGQSDVKRLFAGGRMKLSASAAPGEYVLQIVVTDATNAAKPRIATQWIDFEIVE